MPSRRWSPHEAAKRHGFVIKSSSNSSSSNESAASMANGANGNNKMPILPNANPTTTTPTTTRPSISIPINGNNNNNRNNNNNKDRCIYYTPPPAASAPNAAAAGQQQYSQKGLRRFLFFGDSPHPPAPSSSFSSRSPFLFPQGRPPLDESDGCGRGGTEANCWANGAETANSPPFLAAIRAGRSILAGGPKQRQNVNASNHQQPFFQNGIPPRSHSSRTVSLDFDSESTGTTIPVEEIASAGGRQQRNKCNGAIANHHHQQQKHQQQQSGAAITASAAAPRRHSQYQQMIDSSPPSAGYGQRRRPAPNSNGGNGGGANQQQMAMHFGGGSQFDTQSLQARRSRSFAASAHHHQQMSSYPNGGGTGTPSSGQYPHHQQYSQHPPQPQQTPIVRCGSCSNLSLAGGAGGQMVLYEGTPIGHELAQSQHRHSMIANLAPPAAPIWYIPPSSIPPPLPPPPFAPPPPFYYTAATLPHPATPMDYKSFKQAIKETERMEKKQRKLMLSELGTDSFGCCEFCCGGSALILWLVISLVALGFLGFLLLAIYFV